MGKRTVADFLCSPHLRGQSCTHRLLRSGEQAVLSRSLDEALCISPAEDSSIVKARDTVR